MFPILKDKRFTDISTNENVRVVDQFENIAILDNGSRINVQRLLDRGYYDEFIDPLEFLGQQSLNTLAEKIKAIPIESIQSMAEDDEPIVTEYDPEEEKRAILERARNLNSSNAVQSQMDKFKELELVDDVDYQEITHSDPILQPSQATATSFGQVTQSTISVPVVDPILAMFSNVKRNTNFKLTIDITDKIPRPDFIEMMEDSYEVSIIDYLADEFVKKILSNPDNIKDSIKQEIKNIVYKKKAEKPIRKIQAKPPTDKINGIEKAAKNIQN